MRLREPSRFRVRAGPRWLLLGCALLAAAPAAAQVTTRILAQPPGPGGFGDGLELMEGPGGLFTIDEATFGDRSGSNLFFSFEQFDVGSGDTAFYTGAPADFVISRVGGGAPSRIFGAIESDILGADHIFVNPAGVVFGPGSSVETGGSFHVTTADFVRFGDPETGPVWDTADCCSRLVSAAPPAAFGFTRPDAAGIHLDRVAPDALAGSVPAGETFSAVGGEVRVTGLGSGQRSLVARAGTIQLAAVSGPGDGGAVEVPLDLGELDLDGIDPQQLGTVRIEEAAFLETTSFRTGEPTIGHVVVRAGRLEVVGSQTGFASVIDSGGAGSDPTPDPAIDVQVADEVVIDGGQLFASPLESGTGGDLRLAGRRLDANDAQIAIRSSADGLPGRLELDFEEIELAGLTDIGSLAEGSQPGADVLVTADRVVALGSGGFGSLFTLARRLGVQGGDLILDVRELEVRSGARIGSGTSSTGDAGDVFVSASDSLLVAGGAQGPAELSARAVSPTGAGAAGDIRIETGSLRVEDGGLVTATSTRGTAAGNVSIQAREVSVLGRDPNNAANRSAIVALSQSGGGPAGSVSIDAPALLVANGGLVSVSSADATAGASGDIAIESDRVRVAHGGSITTEAFSSNPDAGGDVRIHAASLVDVEYGEIRTNTPFSNAGDVSIQSRAVVLQGAGAGGETIVASAAGTGGNIAIGAKGFFVSGGELLSTGVAGRFASFDGGRLDSLLDASSRFGIAGEIGVTAPDAAIAGQLATLSDALYDREDLLRNQCEVRPASVGSLTVRGRDRIPAPPDEDLRILQTPDESP